MNQHTLNDSFTLSSVGLHTGLNITATFLPAPENTGICLRRVDLPGQPCYQALADYVSATERGTVLEHGKWKISTVEHALSALYALGVDNCIVEVNGPEMPILDGSARFFVREIQRVGLKEQDAERKEYIVREPVEYISEHGHRLRIEPCDHYEVDVTIAFQSILLREQHASLTNLADYPQEIAAARTFCFVREIEPLLRVGLIKGGDLKNALVIYETQMSQDGMDYFCDKLGQPHMDATKLGYLSPLNYQNEPARHKLLDVIGDFSLLGMRIRGKITAFKPGHTFNTQCVRRLRNQMLSE
ncbi:MAG: UDP-3-O-[3-hydroxymyristoyl] N-acetylglucosamine deacetylase [Paludibacteraceae bacterium]|nr:UDP-3-O-[3-hydroxymyristoyl] N-acetylglucosamine deacetylase [Paludibacteraceae bacterium]